jgi:hypothetical protein
LACDAEGAPQAPQVVPSGAGVARVNAERDVLEEDGFSGRSTTSLLELLILGRIAA